MTEQYCSHGGLPDWRSVGMMFVLQRLLGRPHGIPANLLRLSF
jgi:hypothetical protein